MAAASSSLPAGLGPLSLRYAYGLEYSSLAGGVGQTVAVVTEYGDSTAESDMADYRSKYSLPACGSGCFSVVDENGGTNYPPAGPAGWTLADAQALDTISAICPNCHILLVGGEPGREVRGQHLVYAGGNVRDQRADV
jgi:subtilase family serine protease